MTSLCPDIKEEDIQGIHFFKCIARESIRGLLECCSTRFLSAREILIHVGNLNSTVYFILDGRLRIHLHSLDSEPVALLETGESVGEMSVIDKQPTSAYVVADQDSRLLVMDEDILWSLVRSSHAAACSLLFTLTKRLRQADAVICKGVELENLFHHYGSVDALTGLHNRYWLDNALQRLYQRCILDGATFSLIMIDIDHFKQFNDRYGHLYGDRVLYSIGQTMMQNLRPSEVIARYGGDEFIIILANLDIQQAKEVADRIHTAVLEAAPLIHDGHEIFSRSISVGVAELKPGQSLEMLISDADSALYRAKNKGRNCVSL
jgi:diguanylate cyclase (GGDEF)-like protein